METVLVTAIGSFSADAVISKLRAAGLRVVGCDIYPAEWLATSLEVEACYHAPLARDAEEYIDFICSTIRRESASFIMPLTDIEVDVLNAHRDVVEACGVTLCISPRETIDICRDKKAFFDFVNSRDLGIKLIPTHALAALEKPAEYPVVAKPANGRSSEGLVIVHGENDWTWLKGHADADAYIVQPFVEGRIVTVDVIRDPQSGASVAIPREELLRTPNGAGTSVRVFSDEELTGACHELANALGIRGCVNFEFIHDGEGKYWLVECNPRFSGGVKFSCMTGYDCVVNHLRCFTGEAIDELQPYVPHYITRKYQEIVTM